MAGKYKQVRENMIQSLGQLAESAGFNRTLGQIYGLLYLSPGQLSLSEIAENLGISKGSASLNMQSMKRWGMIRRFNRPADRQDYYEVEINFWNVIRGILLEREKKKIIDLTKMLNSSLKDVKKTGSGAADKEAEFYQERLKYMLDFLNTFNQVLNAYLALENFRLSSLTGTNRTNINKYHDEHNA